MNKLITAEMPATDEVLNAIAYLPTKSLSKIADDGFSRKPTDRDFMRIDFLLAMKSYEEGGSPIGDVITNFSGTGEVLRQKGVRVNILEDPELI